MKQDGPQSRFFYVSIYFLSIYILPQSVLTMMAIQNPVDLVAHTCVEGTEFSSHSWHCTKPDMPEDVVFWKIDNVLVLDEPLCAMTDRDNFVYSTFPDLLVCWNIYWTFANLPGRCMLSVGLHILGELSRPICSGKPITLDAHNLYSSSQLAQLFTPVELEKFDTGRNESLLSTGSQAQWLMGFMLGFVRCV